TPATTRIAGGAARIAETARRLHRASGRTDAREGALPARECDMEGMLSLCLSARTLASLPRLEPPVLIPGRLGAHPLAGDRHLDQVRAVVARDPVHTAPDRRLELLRGGDALAVHALSAPPTPHPSEPPPLRVQPISRYPNGSRAVRAVELSWTMMEFRGRSSASCASSTAGCTIGSC